MDSLDSQDGGSNRNIDSPTNGVLAGSRKFTWVHGILALAFAGLVAWVLFVVSSTISGERSSTRANRVVNDAWSALDFSTTTLDHVNSLSEGLSGDSRAKLQLRLGHMRNFLSDYRGGIPLIKEVIADESVSPEIRSLAIGYLFLSYTNGRDTRAAEVIFDDTGIYRTALAGGDIRHPEDLGRAMHNLFLVADSWYETSFIKYLLALQAAGRLLDDATLSASEKQESVQTVIAYVTEGDVLWGHELARDDYSGSVFQRLAVLSTAFRFYNLTVIARFDESYRSKAESAYDEMMRQFARYRSEGNNRFIPTEGYIRLYYAAYLADVYGEDRAPHIRGIIAPTIIADGVEGEANELGIWRFYKLELTRDVAERQHNERFILSVAKYAPDFDAFLISKGWK